MSGTATYELGEQILREKDEAETVLRRTRILAIKLLPQAAGHLRRHIVPTHTLVALKRELEAFDLRSNSWKAPK